MERIWLKNYDPNVPYDIECSIEKPFDFLNESSEKFPRKDAIIFFNYELTYGELKEKVDKFASFLIDLGVKRGDRVALDLPNSPQYIIAYYAINKIGAIEVQISPTYFSTELNHILSDSKPAVLITFDDVVPRLKDVNYKEMKIVVTRIQDYLNFPLSSLYSLNQKLKKKYIKLDNSFIPFNKFEEYKPLKDRIGDRNDVAVLQYTGGTTGTPKGAMLTNYNLVCNTLQSLSVIPDVEMGKEYVISAIPFFHVFGMTVALNFPVKIGATMLLQPKPDIDGIFKLIKKYKPMFLPGVPTIYINMLNNEKIKEIDMTPLKYCISGSAPLPVDVIRRWEKVTNGGHLVEGYGLTEASPVTHLNPLKGKIKAGSIGVPVASTYAKIVDLETGEKELPIGEEGELIIKGPQVMKGYWNNEEETKNVLKNGWLYTGDIAKMDEDGYFYIVDRKKDVIIVGGFNVYPREVEEILYQHPKVKEAAVVGVKEEIHGEVVKAFIVLKDGETATEEEIKKFFDGKIAKFKIPRVIEFRKELPKTMVGKILRRELRNEGNKN